MTEYLRPRSLAEALSARRDHPSWTVVAGGTDLMVGALERPAPCGLLDLFGLSELCGVRRDGDRVWIGAATPYAHLLEDALVARELPALRACVREIGAAQIQARGTLGGNIATSSPVGDSLPCLLAYEAVVHLASTRGPRTLPYTSFCIGYRKTAIAADEIITAVEIPIPRPGTTQLWRKVGTRRAQSISKVMLAALGRVEKGRIAEARLGMGAVADRPLRLHAVEAMLVGRSPDEATADEAQSVTRAGLTPLDDVRSSKSYRSHVAGAVVRRFVLSLEFSGRAH